VKTIGSKIQGFVLRKNFNLRYIVLAERNSANLAEGIRSLYASWDRMRRSVFWKRHVVGCIAVLEITYSVERASWHPHLNVLFEGEYIPFQLLNLKWQKATKDNGRTSRIQKANEGTVYELIKYTLKVAEYKNTTEGRVLQLLFDDPRVLDEFLSAVYGVRLIRTYGIFRSMGDVESEEEQCPDCGSTCIVDLGPVDHRQLSFDFSQEVFRVTRTVAEVARAWLKTVAFETSSLTAEIRKMRMNVPMAVEARQKMRTYERAVANMFKSAA